MSTHGGPTEIPLLDSVISNAVTPGSDVCTALSPQDREDISLLFLEVREFLIVMPLFTFQQVSCHSCSLHSCHLYTCATPSL